MGQGHDESSAYGMCYAAVVEGKSEALDAAAKLGFELTEADKLDIAAFWAGKYGVKMSYAIKAVGDWELDVLAIPFGSKDSDGQWFDAKTNIMPDQFQTPLIAYQHGISQGAKSLQDEPIQIGEAVPGSLHKESDGWHIKVVLNKAKKLAQGIMDAARKGMVAVSSGSINHMARLDIGGKLIMYEKNRPGRIAIWPLAEVSIWEKGNGNLQPANRFAVALPAMKAIYRKAGMLFPDVDNVSADAHGGSEAQKANRAKIAEIQKKSKELQKFFKEHEI